MLMVALFLGSKMWKQSKCPSADELINKMGYIHTMGYFSVIIIKKNEVLRHTRTWMKLENMLRSQSQRTTHYMILLV